MNGITTSTLQQWIVDAGSTAGSTAAVISEESMKCLKYCCHWLQYAIQHTQQQMNILRNDLTKDTLETIKNEMIATLKKAIDVVTCYAGHALPYQAKMAIRKSILSLPDRWAILNKESDPEETLATRLLMFGQESSDMLNSVYQVFEDTVQRAESWLKSINAIPILKSFTDRDKLAEEAEDQELYHLLISPIRNLKLSS